MTQYYDEPFSKTTEWLFFSNFMEEPIRQDGS